MLNSPLFQAAIQDYEPQTYSYLSNVAAIAGYIGNSKSIRVAGYSQPGDGGNAFYTLANTGFPTAAVSGAAAGGGYLDARGRLWYLDVYSDLGNMAQVCPSDGTDIGPNLQAFMQWLASVNKGLFTPTAPTGRSWALNSNVTSTIQQHIWEQGANILYSPTNTSFSATFAGGVMTVPGAVTGPAIAVGMALYNSGQTPLMITAQLTATTWQVSKSFTLAVATTIYAVPDLNSALTFTLGRPFVKNPNFTGPDGTCTTDQLDSLGWILFTAKNISGTWPAANQFQVTAGGQNIAIGNQMVCAGQMFVVPSNGPAAGLTTAPVVTVIAITGAGTAAPLLTLSASIVPITGTPTFDFHNLPNYNAICSGSTGITFAGNCVPIVEGNVSTKLKTTIVFNCYGGHSENWANWATGAIFSVYYQADGGDNHMMLGSYFGALGGVGLGNTNLSNNNCYLAGGLNVMVDRSQFNFASGNGFYQVSQNGAMTGNGITGLLIFPRFESVQESAITLLPSANSAFDMYGQSANWSTTATHNMPTTIVGNPRTSLFNLGNIQSLGLNVNGLGQAAGNGPFIPDTSGGGVYAQFTISGIGGLATSGRFDGFWAGTPTNIASSNADLQRYLTGNGPDQAWKTDFSAYKDMATTGNLLKNPEIAANWSSTTGVTVTNSSFAASDLNGVYVIPPSILAILGPNPSITKIAMTQTGNATLRAANATIANELRKIWGRAWILSLASPFQYTCELLFGAAGGTAGYTHFQTPFVGVAQQILGFDKTSAFWGDTSDIFYGFRFTTTTSAFGIVYLFGVQAGWDEQDTYNAAPGPNSSVGTISLGNGYTVANLTLAMAALYPAGTISFALDGRNTGEAAAAGTGCNVFVKPIAGVNTWCAVWSGVAVTS